MLGAAGRPERGSRPRLWGVVEERMHPRDAADGLIATATLSSAARGIAAGFAIIGHNMPPGGGEISNRAA